MWRWLFNFYKKQPEGVKNNMELLLKRTTKTDISTIGELTIDGLFECFILEDKDRGLYQLMTLEKIKEIKQYGKTAIPTGKYEVAITFSNKFKKYLPLLLDVKGYEGIRIHPGNTEVDTLGCLLPGTIAGKDVVSDSRAAFLKLFAKLEEATKVQKVFITIG